MSKRLAIQDANVGLSVESVKERVRREGDTGDLMPNPLETAGFLNIRIKPPLHSRGIGRMTLPADVTVIICGPLNTGAQRTDYDNLNEFFSSLDSQYITAMVRQYIYLYKYIFIYIYLYIYMSLIPFCNAPT
jgi:hypothetical protein